MGFYFCNSNKIYILFKKNHKSLGNVLMWFRYVKSFGEILIDQCRLPQVIAYLLDTIIWSVAFQKDFHQCCLHGNSVFFPRSFWSAVFTRKKFLIWCGTFSVGNTYARNKYKALFAACAWDYTSSFLLMFLKWLEWCYRDYDQIRISKIKCFLCF